MWKNSEYSNFR